MYNFGMVTSVRILLFLSLALPFINCFYTPRNPHQLHLQTTRFKMPPNQGLSPKSIVELLDDSGNGRLYADTQEFPTAPSTTAGEGVNEGGDNGEGLIRVAILGCGMMGQVCFVHVQ